MLDHLRTYWVGVVDKDNNEPADPLYRRVRCLFVVEENGMMVNIQEITFPQATENWGTMCAFVLYDKEDDVEGYLFRFVDGFVIRIRDGIAPSVAPYSIRQEPG